MRGRRGLILIMLAAAALAILFLFVRKEPEQPKIDREVSSTREAHEPESSSRSAPQTARPQVAAPAHEVAPPSPSPPARVLLARPTTPPKAQPMRVAERRGLTDKRGAGHATAKDELEALNYGMDTLDEDIEECLEQWTAQSSTVTGEAMLAFQIDRKGLTNAWLAGGEQIPFGPRTCIANAVYGIDWSNIVEKPAEISRRFDLQKKDR